MKRDRLRQSLVYLFVALVVFTFVNVSWADGVEVEVPYAVTNTQWWTGVAIKNLDASSSTGDLRIDFIDQEGVFMGAAELAPLEPQEIYSEMTSTIYPGPLPLMYSIIISHSGNQELAVTVFVGNSATGGFAYQTYKQTPAVLPSWHQIIPAAERFELVMNNEAVLDRETDLVWQRDTSETIYDWYAAQSYCYNIIIGSRGGWRLPSVEELKSLVDPTQVNPALPDDHPFTNVKNYYWSSSTRADVTTYAWFVKFYYGYAGNNLKTNSYYVRAVRGGQ